jgi:type I restriction enzyme S subunit
MSVREGYQQTEIGVIPEEWEVVELKSIGQIVTGSTPKTSNQEYYTNGTRLWASPSDLGKSKEVKSTTNKLTDLGFEQTRVLPARSILVTCIGSTIGKIGMAYEEMSTNQQINSLVCTKENSSDFYYYVLDMKKEYIKNLAGTQAVPLLNKSDFSVIKVPKAPIEEQQKIAEILSTVDQKIDSIDTKIKETQTLKRGLMQRLLSEGIGHSEFKESEIGRIPTGWEVVKIGEVCKFTQGVQIPIEEQHTIFQEELVRFLRISDYTQNTSDIRFVPKSYMNNFITSEDIVMVRYGETAGHIGMGFAGVLANNLFTMTPKSDLLSKQYLYHFFKQPSMYEYLKKLRAAGAMPAVNFKSLSIIRIPIPSHKEQEKISETMFAMDEKLDTLRAKKEAFETLKKGLMQKLLTGEVRVNV